EDALHDLSDAPLARDGWRVDVVDDRLEAVAEEAAQHGGGERAGLALGRLAARLDGDLERGLGDELRLEGSELLGEQKIGAEDLQDLGRERWHVDRVLDDVAAEEVGHLLR